MNWYDSLQSSHRRHYGREASSLALAPGRIEFIGNHTDYNGGSVLGLAIDRHVGVAVAPCEGDAHHLRTEGVLPPVDVRISHLQPLRGDESWANYLLGVWSLLREHGVPGDQALEFTVQSDLPTGAGLSSSAALELAAGLALQDLFGSKLSREELVQLCRRAENEFVGVPCGILDQGVCGLSRAGSLLHIDCRGPVFSHVPLPAGVDFLVVNTGTKHSLQDSLYAARHAECRQAWKILAAGFPGREWLAEIRPEEWKVVAGQVPEPCRQRASHIIFENARVEEMRKALAGKNLARAGRLLTESHGSSRDLFANSTPELDFLVLSLSALPGVYGARLTGGGFGGAVMALLADTFDQGQLPLLIDAYSEQFGHPPVPIFLGSASGARVLSPGQGSLDSRPPSSKGG